MGHCLIPFLLQEDKATKHKVRKALQESLAGLKGLQEVRVPNILFPLPSANETLLVASLSHCKCLSTFLVGGELCYSVMVGPGPESAAYTTANVQDGIHCTFPAMMDDTWVDPSKGATVVDDNKPKETWDGRA